MSGILFSIFASCEPLKLPTPFWKIIYTSYSKLSKELKNSIKIQVGRTVLELLIQTTFLTVLIHNLKTVWSTKISMPFLSFFDNLLLDAYIIFQKSVDNFETEHKTY